MAADTAEFDAEHKRFFEMHDLIFENHSALGGRLPGQPAEQLGLDANAVRESVRSGEFSERVGARLPWRGTQRRQRNTDLLLNGARHDSSFDLTTLADANKDAAAPHR